VHALFTQAALASSLASVAAGPFGSIVSAHGTEARHRCSTSKLVS